MARTRYALIAMRRKLLLAYLALLMVSHLVAWGRGPATEGVEGDLLMGLQTPALGAFQLNYQDRPCPRADAPVVVLLHGSPGNGHHLDALADELQPHYRVLIPDLPGFGGSTRQLPTYSIRAHAEAVREWLLALKLPPVHLIGFSMGGGVALELSQLQPKSMRSLTMLSAIGVQELELLGTYDLNHAVHGLQLLAAQAADWLLPHFGAISRSPLLPYARNFFDTDQRPLRAALQKLTLPTLILHGADDFLVPAAAAREHHRLVPQSKLVMLQSSHFLPWTHPVVVAGHLQTHINMAESVAPIGPLDPARTAAAALPWSPSDAPPLHGAALLLAMLLIALATLVSEDLTCIATGLLVAQARIGFLPGVVACFLGILIGDGMLFLAGRWFGKPALNRAPLRWMVKPAAVERARIWFHHRGSRVILLSRFMPGMRLTTYVAAGLLGMKFRVFLGYFALAGVLWTPTVVGLATLAGREAYALMDTLHQYALPGFLGLMFTMVGVQKLLVPMFSHRGRRLLYGSLRRKMEWEFWPSWLIYLPIIAYVIGLAIRFGGLRMVTAVNPGIATGGLVGESKWDILQKLAYGNAQPNRRRIPPSKSLPATLFLPVCDRIDGVHVGGQKDPSAAGDTSATPISEAVHEFVAQYDLQWPMVVKPDVGERGKGVQWVHDWDELMQRLQHDSHDLLLQQAVRGIEFGIFYWREPGTEKGTIFSINGKQFPSLTGDGRRTLEQLILDDDRAVRMASVHFNHHSKQLFHTPTEGRTIELVDIGAHSRGTIFTDCRDLSSDALRQSLDQISDSYPGFHFGRFDVIATSADDLAQGKNFRILELNGLTAEAAHIYDPRYGVGQAWRTLMQQWKMAFRIASINRHQGHEVSSWRQLWHGWKAHRLR
jgi:pimeloyl-ACP methyl ester carboxylesterase/membrane protein DedA with SNARE-associated domain